MRTMVVGALVIVIIGLSNPRLPAAVEDDQEAAQRFLSTTLQLRGPELAELVANRPVSRTLETSDGREIAALGAIRVRVPAAFYIARLRDIVRFKESKTVLQIGAFRTPARLDDVRGMTLDPAEVESLERCRPGSCMMQLSRDAMQRFQQEAPWRNPDPLAAANRIMRAVVVEMVNAYRESGDGGLMTYADAKAPVSVADEFRAMIMSPPAMLARFPSLHQHVMQFPRTTRGDVEDVIYWSKEQLGPRAVLSVTHLAIAQLSGHEPAAYAVASRQIYGSHYFDASLGLTVLVRDSASQTPASYLVYVNHSRLDALGGVLGSLKGMAVRSRARAAMSNSLIETRDRVERQFQTEPRPRSE